MTTAQIEEVWHAHCATTDAVALIVSARTLKERRKALRAYQDADRRFYRAWQVVAREADAVPVDPVDVAQDREVSGVVR